MEIGTAQATAAPGDNQGADDADPVPDSDGQMGEAVRDEVGDDLGGRDNRVGQQHEIGMTIAA